jgi:hypothetical protein
LQVNSQLLAFFVKMAAFEAQSASNIGHVKVVAANLREQNLFLEGFSARSERAGQIVLAPPSAMADRWAMAAGKTS